MPYYFLSTIKGPSIRQKDFKIQFLCFNLIRMKASIFTVIIFHQQTGALHAVH